MADAEEREEEEEEEEVAVAEEEQEEVVGDLYWVRERLGSYWPCQAVTPAMVPPAEAARHGQVRGSGTTWVKLFNRGGQYLPLQPWRLTPLVGSTPSDLQKMGAEEDRVKAFNQAMFAKFGH